MARSANNNEAAQRRAPNAAATVEFIKSLDPERALWVLCAFVNGVWTIETFSGPSRSLLAERWISRRYADGGGVWLVLADAKRPISGQVVIADDLSGYRLIAATSIHADTFTTAQARRPLSAWIAHDGAAIAVWKLPAPVAMEEALRLSALAASDCCVGRNSARAQLYYLPLPRDMSPTGIGGSIVRMPKDVPAGDYLGIATSAPAQGGYAPEGAAARPISDGDSWLAYSLSEALESQGVTGGKVVGMTRGPVVTVCDYEPDRRAKSASILKVANDVARLIKSASVIARPDHARGVICFDVVNKKRDVVSYEGLVASEAWKLAKATMRLPVLFGVTSAGEPVISDYARAVHVLEAGSTGSGKSTGMNASIMSMLEARGPDRLRLLLIDPKRVELASYGPNRHAPTAIPHLLAPVANSAEKGVYALEWALKEMLRRYDVFLAEGAESIWEYNELLAERRAAGEPDVPADMFAILIVIDEYAMLLQQAEKRVSPAVRRMSAEARAAGMHILLATQHPSAKMMTGEIRTNFPWAITYFMAKPEGSIVAVGSGIACSLAGDGDALLSRGKQLERMHAPYLSKAALRARLAAVRAMGEPEFAFDYAQVRPLKASDAGSGYMEDSPVFDAGSGDFGGDDVDDPDDSGEDSAQGAAPKAGARDSAIADLCRLMPRGQRMARADLWREMQARGHTKGTFDRAAKDMGVEVSDCRKFWTR